MFQPSASRAVTLLPGLPGRCGAQAVAELGLHRIKYAEAAFAEAKGQSIAWDSRSGAEEPKHSLVEGAKFHDGTEFNADDVKFSLERINAEGSLNAQKALYADIASVEALRELQIELAAAQGERPTGSGEVLVRLMLADGDQVQMRLGSNFVLNGELAERLAAVEGIAKVALVPLKKRGNLRLVA